VLSSTQIFKDCFLDSGFINQQAQKWGLSLWLSMTVSSNLWSIWVLFTCSQIFPHNWVDKLWEMELLNLKIFWNESCRLDPPFIQQDNAERIFTIWTYLEYQNRKSNAPQRIYGQRHEIFMRASRSLTETSSTTQIALDLMTMTSTVSHDYSHMQGWSQATKA
jgi:hypothetical protein